MQISREGIDLIKRHEGVKLKAYLCPAGVWTIGYGSTRNVTEGMKITLRQAEELLLRDLSRFEKAVNRMVQVELNQQQYDALVSLVFNIGDGAFARSTLLKRLNAGKYHEAAEQFTRWNKAGGKVLPGLVKRRAEERELFLQGMQPAPLKPLTKSREIIGTTIATVGTAGEIAITEAKDAIEPIVGHSDTLRWVFIALVLAGLALTLYGRLSNRRRGIV